MARPADWQTATKMIRLPLAYEPQLKEAGHWLEAGDRIISAAKLEAEIRAILQTMRPQDRRAAARAYQRLLARLAESQLALQHPQNGGDIEPHQ